MADTVVEGVWWLHETRGSNVFLVRTGDRRLALVDTGFGSSAPGIVDEVERIAPGEPVAFILLTHAHFDHTGAARALREHYGAKVAAGDADCVVDHEGRASSPGRIGASHLFRWFRRRAQEVRHVETSVPVDIPLSGETEVAPGLLAVPVPGHTPGAYCYVDRARGIAFVGDLIISHTDGLARSLPAANHDDAQYLRTLAEFAVRAPDAACPGHGAPVLEGFREQLTKLAALPRRRFPGLRERWRRFRRLRAFARTFRHRHRP